MFIESLILKLTIPDLKLTIPDLKMTIPSLKLIIVILKLKRYRLVKPKSDFKKTEPDDLKLKITRNTEKKTNRILY